MAFNGTKNFPKQDLVNYLESIGMKFGPEVNAQTSFNETLYMLTLPTDSAHIVEKGFQIMEDWAHNITFDGVEIDKERGIIIEEWRLNQGLNQRLMDQLYPALFEGSQYASRIPLGKKEIIEGAPHATIKRFYTDWYRPELMAFVVVGDIDPDAVEKSIRDHFSALTNPSNPRFRKSFPIPDHTGIKPLVISDKEMPMVQMALFTKINPEKSLLQKDYRKSLIYNLISGMLSQRLNELREQANPPILGSQANYANMMPEKSIFQLVAIAPETGIEKGLEAMITECERAVQHGFTSGELDRQKKEIFTSYENAFNEREKTNSVNYASEYLRNFLLEEPIPGIEFEFDFVKEFLQGIALEEVNEVLRKSLTHDNRLLVVISPQKEGLQLPDNDKILTLVASTSAKEILPYVDKVTGNQLMKDKPKKGRILLAKNNDKLGVVEMKLSNGAKVILKPTDFKNDQVLFSAYSPGGYSVYEAVDHQSAYYSDDIVAECGVADYSVSDISKLLAGKNVSVSPYISEYYEGLSGSAVPKDIESMFQLAYLYFTAPRKDSAMFESLMTLQKEYFRNATSNPEAYFGDQFTRAKTQNNPRADIIPSEAEIAQVNMNRLYEIYNERFADAADFTFFIVGAFKVDSIKTFIEDYLASLPSLRLQETWKDMGIRPPAKKTDLPVYKGNEPKSRVGLYFETLEPWDPMEDYVFESLGQLLTVRYLDVIREELSGAYTISASSDLSKIPYSRAMLNVIIPCSPENTNALTKAALNEIRMIQKNGVTPEDLNKVKEAQRRDLEKNLKENGFWIGQLANGYRNNDPEMVNRYAEWMNGLTSEKLQAAAQKINLKNYIRVVLYPEKN
jgi:zinc protease